LTIRSELDKLDRQMNACANQILNLSSEVENSKISDKKFFINKFAGSFEQVEDIRKIIKVDIESQLQFGDIE